MKKNKKQSFEKDNILNAPSAIEPFYNLGEQKISKFVVFLNEKKFRVSDTDFSYRQINSLDDNNVLEDTRETKNNWRKFSFKELIFLSIIKELRGYGFKSEQIKKLSNVFFGEKTKEQTDFAIGIVFIKLKITLLIDNKNNISFYDFMAMEMFFSKEHKSFININLNEIVSEIWEKMGKKKISYKNYNDIIMESLAERTFNYKEAEIIKIIRDRNYKNIIINKKEGSDADSFIIKADGKRGLTEDEIVKMIREKDFGDIEIVKRNGNIVNVKVEDIYKI
jgi:DNA-binding transcriptional MerR regulator